MSFDDDSQSCLALAVINGIPSLVRRLLDFGGVDINLVPVWSDPNNIPAGYPFSPFQLSVIYQQEIIQRIFIEYGGGSSYITESQLINGLCLSATDGYHGLAIAIMRYGVADINAIGSDFEYTPLQSAMETDNPHIVRLLLRDTRLDLVRNYFHFLTLYLLCFLGKICTKWEGRYSSSFSCRCWICGCDS